MYVRIPRYWLAALALLFALTMSAAIVAGPSRAFSAPAEVVPFKLDVREAPAETGKPSQNAGRSPVFLGDRDGNRLSDDLDDLLGKVGPKEAVPVIVVAPGAALVGIKVLNASGSGTTSGIISGINWMIQNKNTYGIRVGNMSLGSTGSSDGTDSLSQAVNNAVANGIIMVVAAGNSGPARYTIGSPAAAAEAITVGALYDPGEKGWVLAEFSSRGPTADGRIKPDICTPGRYITAAKANSTNGYVTYSGTSIATPFMAGVIALMLDANYSLTDSQVKSIIYSSGNVKDFGPAEKNIDFGYGINLSYNVIKAAGGYQGSFSDGLTFSYTADSLPGRGYSDYWDFTVTDATKPVGITFIMPNHTSTLDFDIYLYNASGSQVASSTGTKRQEQILYLPTVTGTYRLRVYSYSGSGSYWFNISWK